MEVLIIEDGFAKNLPDQRMSLIDCILLHKEGVLYESIAKAFRYSNIQTNLYIVTNLMSYLR